MIHNNNFSNQNILDILNIIENKQKKCNFSNNSIFFKIPLTFHCQRQSGRLVYKNLKRPNREGQKDQTNFPEQIQRAEGKPCLQSGLLAACRQHSVQLSGWWENFILPAHVAVCARAKENASKWSMILRGLLVGRYRYACGRGNPFQEEKGFR